MCLLPDDRFNRNKNSAPRDSEIATHFLIALLIGRNHKDFILLLSRQIERKPTCRIDTRNFATKGADQLGIGRLNGRFLRGM